MVTHLAPIHVVEIALHTVTATHVRHTATVMVALLVEIVRLTATAMALAVTHVLHTATAQPMETAMAELLVATVLHTVTAIHVLHTATAMAQPAAAQLAAPHLAK
jgi:hypothetical protein